MSTIISNISPNARNVITCAVGGGITLMGVGAFMKMKTPCEDRMNCGFNNNICKSCKDNKQRYMLRWSATGILGFGGLAIVTVGAINLFQKN